LERRRRSASILVPVDQPRFGVFGIVSVDRFLVPPDVAADEEGVVEGEELRGKTP
jgi:hypothetical protein